MGQRLNHRCRRKSGVDQWNRKLNKMLKKEGQKRKPIKENEREDRQKDSQTKQKK